jgi:predicted neuraminidase
MKIPVMIILICMMAAVPVMAQAVFEAQLIFPLQEKHVHASSIVESGNGDLLACWFYGSGERRANDVMIQGARLKKGEKVWSAVYKMADTPNLPDCNPVLFIDRQQRLWMFWVVVQAERWERSLLKYYRSLNYQREGPPVWEWQDFILFQPGERFAGAIEQAAKQLSAGEPMWSEYAPPYGRMLAEAARDPVKRQAGWMTRIHPLVLPSGRILLPLYSDGFNVSMAAISDDEGENWRASQPIIGLGPIQPAFVRKKDGSIMAYMRDSGSLPQRIMRSVSTDDGESWTFAADLDIPNPGSSLEVIGLEDGRWVLICNDTEAGRHRLSAYLSDDEGESWAWRRVIEERENGQGAFAYPSLIESHDGMLHLTFSYAVNRRQAIKYVKFNPEWIMSAN